MQKKKESYNLQNFDETLMKYNNELIDQEIQLIHLRLKHHWKKLRLDVMKQSDSDIVLDISWLRTINSMIDWINETITFLHTEMTRLHLILKSSESVKIFAMTVNDMRSELKNSSDAQMLWSRKIKSNLVIIKISKKYQKYKILFEKESDQETLLKHQSWDHEIKLIDDKKLTKQFIYSLSAEKLNALWQYLKKNMRKEFIKESQSSAEYSILFVLKSNESLRLCVDYRALNNITIKNSYSLSLISELQDRLQRAQWFMKFNILEAFNWIWIKEENEWKTVFCTRLEHYEYLIMSFNLINASVTFQTFVNNVLRHYLNQFIIVYLNDILVYSKMKKEHVQHVRKVLQTLKKVDLRIKSEKSEFHVQSVQFLKFIVTSQSLRMNSKKIEAVTTWSMSKSKIEVQFFLEFANFYRRFIERYFRIISSLTNLTKKNILFVWTEKAEEAFEKLKKLFISQSVLIMFESEKSITLEMNASDKAIETCISQSDDKKRLHFIAYYNCKLTVAELNYEIHDKKLLVIINSFKQWRVYLKESRHQIQVYTDHKNLLYFTITKVLNRRQIRWLKKLSLYNFNIQYRKKSENLKINVLSRRADHRANRSQINQTILQQNQNNFIVYNKQNAATLRIYNQDLKKRIKLKLAKDSVAQNIIKNIADNANFEITNKILTFQDLIYVSTRCRQEIISDYHESMIHEHQDSDKIIERISRIYYFSKMRKQVENIIRKCDVCIWTKHSQHRSYKLLKSLSTSDHAWKSIALNFIVKLSKSKERVTKTTYNSILMITDRLIKYKYFLSYKKATFAKDLTYTFLRMIVVNHDLSDEIISNRNKLFTSKFWKSLVNQLEIHHKLSTAYHSQTNEQTKRMNQILKQYLRCYINYRQNDWIQLLLIAQLTFNSTTTKVISMSLFFANYEFELKTLKKLREFVQIAQKVTIQIEQIHLLHKELQKNIQFLSKRMTLYANKKRDKKSTLKKRNKVYLLKRNIKTKRSSNKLNHMKLEFFEILEEKKSINYELNLSTSMRIHSIFHIFLLKSADLNTSIQTKSSEIDSESQNIKYEVKNILDRQNIKDQSHWLVKWKDYEHIENTWESKRNLKNCQMLLWQFQLRNSVSQSLMKSQSARKTRQRENHSAMTR